MIRCPDHYIISFETVHQHLRYSLATLGHQSECALLLLAPITTDKRVSEMLVAHRLSMLQRSALTRQ
jgi:hypothetical protein